MERDRNNLLNLPNIVVEHWRHLQTTNPIESTFATIRLRHRRTKGNGTRQASLIMMFKLAQSAAKKRRKLNSTELILSLVEGKVFTDGVLQLTHAVGSTLLGTQLLTILHFVRYPG